MSCVITYKGNKYTQEQFKEYISSNKNEFSHIIASNENVIDSFKRKMEGIDYVFSQSPELASIGSKAQYLQYLSTIFKTSKVKDIVYHGTNDKNFRPTQNKQGIHFGFKEYVEEWLYRTNAPFNQRYYAIKDELENLDEGEVSEEFDLTREELEEELEVLSNRKTYYFPALLNIKNPKQTAYKAYEWENDIDSAKKNNNDGLIYDIDDKVVNANYLEGQNQVVFEPEQIHILGSKQDIEGFQNFVAQPTTSTLDTDLTPTQPEQKLEDILMQLEIDAGFRHNKPNDRGRKRIVKYEKAFDMARDYNKKNPDSIYKAKLAVIMGEKGDRRVYNAVIIVRKDLEGINSSTKNFLISKYPEVVRTYNSLSKQYFNNSDINSIKNILDKIESSGRYGELVAHVRSFLTSDELNDPDGIMLVEAVASDISAMYDQAIDRIILYANANYNRDPELVLLHEIIHKITNKAYTKANTITRKHNIYKKGQELIDDIIEALADKYSEAYYNGTEENFYGLTNPEELLSEGLTNPKLIKELQTLYYKDKSFINRIVEWLAEIMGIAKKSTMYDQFLEYYKEVIALKIEENDISVYKNIPKFEDEEVTTDTDIVELSDEQAVFDKFRAFVYSLNPNFRFEVLDDLLASRGVNAIADIRNFTIRLQRGKGRHISEEIAHFYVELLSDEKLAPMMDTITYTRLYKKVVQQYMEVYGSDFDRLKREAIAQMIALQMDDPKAARYWAGSDTVWEAVSRLIADILKWFKGQQSAFQDFVGAAEDILGGNVSNLSLDKALTAPEMFSYDQNPNKIETLGGQNIHEFDSIYININDTLLDYKNYPYSGNNKFDMFKPGNEAMLDRYYATASLTELGKELMDKRHVLPLGAFTVYTDLPITEALIMRVQSIFGEDVVPIRILETTQEVDKDNSETRDYENIRYSLTEVVQEAMSNNPNFKVLIVDDKVRADNDTFYTNVSLYQYRNTYRYFTVAEKVRQQDARRKKQEIRSRYERLRKAMTGDDIKNLSKALLIFTRKVKSDVKSLEFIDKILKDRFNRPELQTFLDENGDVALPEETARAIGRALSKNQYLEAMITFTQALEQIGVFFNNFSRNNFKEIRDKIEAYQNANDQESLDIAMFEINKLSSMIAKWDDYINSVIQMFDTGDTNMTVLIESMTDTKQKIRTAKNKLFNIAASATTSALMPMVEPYNINKRALIKELQDKYNANPLPSIKKRIEELETEIITAENLIDILMNNNVEDIAGHKIYTKTLSDFEDPLVGSVARIIRMAEQEVSVENTKKVQEFTTEVEEAKKGLTESELGTLTVKEKHFITVDGKKELVESNALLNEYQNLYIQEQKLDEYIAARDAFQEATTEYNIALSEGTVTPAMEDEYEAKKKEFAKIKREWNNWSNTNFHNQYTAEYHRLYNELIDSEEKIELMEEVREIQANYYDQIESLKNNLDIASPEDAITIMDDIRQLRSQLRSYRSDYNADGTMKTGHSLKIARMFQDKVKVDTEVFETVFNVRKFKDEARPIMRTKILKHQQAYKQFLDAKDFNGMYAYAIRHSHTDVKEWIESNTMVRINDAFYQEKQVIFKKIDVLQQQVNDLLGVQTNTTLTDMWNQIFDMSSQFRDEYGVLNGNLASTEMQQKVKELQIAINEIGNDDADTVDLDETDQERLVELLDELRKIRSELSDIQTRTTSQYYNDSLLNEMINSSFRDYFFEKTGIYITNGTPVNVVIKNNFYVVEEFLEQNPDDLFTIWFNNNHYTAEEMYRDANGDQLRRVVYRPTYLWGEILPKKSSHVSRMPNEKYAKRKVKNAYMTVKNDRTWDSNLNMWKPKTPTFYNPKYAALKNSTNPKDQKLFKVLELRTKYHIGNQVEAGSVGRLGYRLPYVAIDPTVQTTSWFKNLWGMFKRGANFFEAGEDNFNATDSGEKKTLRAAFNDLFKSEKGNIPGYDYFKIAVPYTKYMKPEETSNEVDFNLVLYGNGVSKAGRLLKLNPLFKTVERTLEQSMDNNRISLELDRKVNNVARSKKGNTNRLQALKFLFARDLYGYNKAFEVTRGVDRAVTVMKEMTTFGALGSTPAGFINILKNNLQGRLQNIINADFADWSSNKTMARAAMHLGSNYFNFINETARPVNKRSLDYHIITFFNPSMTDDVMRMVARQNNPLKKTIVNDKLYIINKAGEFSLTVNMLYAHLFHVKVTNGSETKELKDILYVENNSLAVRPGWSVVKTGREVDISYLMDTQLAYRSVLQYVQGKVSEKTLSHTMTITSAALYFKGWLIPMLRRRFGARRKNYMVGQDLEGYWRTSFNIMVGLFQEGKDHWHTLTQTEKYNLYTTAREVAVMMFTSFLISVLYGFDVDDEDKYQKLKEKGWLYNTTLRILLQAKGETESLSPMIGYLPGIGRLTIEGDFLPPVLSEGKNIIQNPFIMMSLFTNYIKFTNSFALLLAGSEKAYYDRNIPLYNIEKGDSKASHYLQKMLGLDAIVYATDNPEGRVMSYLSVLRR